jgi:exopolysaccharide production protein ExoZ
MYQSLQACRAAAAMLVVLFHLGGTFAQPKYFGFAAMDRVFAWGDAGVEFFFVLSGFLITLVHRRDFGRPRALPAYLAKRTLRIYPTYWVVCAAVCLAAWAVPALRAALPSDAWVFLKALALIPQDPVVVGALGSPILFVAWSLQYEMMFYAVIAAFIVNRGLGLAIALAMAVLNLGCTLGSASCGFPQAFIGSNLVLLFALGVAAAYVVKSDWRMRSPLVVAALAALGFVGFGVFEVWVGREAIAAATIDRRLVFGALAAVAVVALAQAEDAGRLVVTGRWPGLLGDASYALYLLHIPVISVLVKLFARLGASGTGTLVLLFALTFAACVGTAVLFHWYVERPMLGWLRGGWRRSPARGTPVHGVRLQ